MTRAKRNSPEVIVDEETVEAVSEDTAQIELERLQKKLAREERKRRKEIETASQKKAVWVLPALLLTTMIIAFVFSNLRF
ncbi:MAG: hypothetical protein Q4G02_01185 [bacterium]|nr:hypothetical protein [bacterium]